MDKSSRRRNGAPLWSRVGASYGRGESAFCAVHFHHMARRMLIDNPCVRRGAKTSQAQSLSNQGMHSKLTPE